ncbi:pyridoxamine 5'-phosphate oxidase family protein [Herbiconiux sp. CPCC 205763]|uniref:Pyridoxamine 5'-phosphate oxidase family protein n=1 Tax=Herbiconiux aconitum TaxID=2970913 RepID=A0ABT2GTG2_9MICO|nr:pyridoxamine 5'-phosphate oxidase family protein [Herbiconiux aconitum]MCS5718141.1 pyridoxamine 5'-phosphate oxidase family protein [Herbiconiux aconitum]
MTTNPYLHVPRPAAAVDDSEALETEECWRLLAETPIARLSVCDDLGADIFPINFLAASGSIFFRSAPGTKIVDLTRRPGVAVEIDGTDGGKRFSVVVRGDAQRLNDDEQIHESGVTELHTMTCSDKWNYFEVTPRTITGIRFRTSRRANEPISR